MLVRRKQKEKLVEQMRIEGLTILGRRLKEFMVKTRDNIINN